MDVINKFLELSGLRKDEIEIKVIGMRPGEKIKEELWSEREEVMPTSHPKLFSIKTVSYTHLTLPTKRIV